MRIVQVIDKRVKQLVEDATLTTVKGFNRVQVRKVSDMIAAIKVVSEPAQLAINPAWRVHQLKGERRGTWSLTVTGNERLTFSFDPEEGTVALLDYEDYH
jgi:proteic killer suppression protein